MRTTTVACYITFYNARAGRPRRVIDTRPARSGVEEELVAPADDDDDDDAHIIIIYVPVAREYIILYYYTRVYNIIMREFTTPCNIYIHTMYRALLYTYILARTHSSADMALYTYWILTDTRRSFVSDIMVCIALYGIV